VRSNWPIFAVSILKKLAKSIGHFVLGGIYTNVPSEKTAAFNAAKKLSVFDTTLPRYFLTSFGCFFTASENGKNIIPCFSSSDV
jgi:hypothetical protein